MTDRSLPYSFNEAYLEELRLLRPSAFSAPEPEAGAPASDADAPEPITGAPFEPGGESDTVTTPQQQERAANLRDIFAAVHGRLRPANSGSAPPLSALCLSGGGIRSATFNLGVLQRLAGAGLVSRFDYLSSVSGGGYISGWLQSWMHRAGTTNALSQLAVPPVGGFPPTRDPLAPEAKPVDHLREYSNYLTPKVGMFSPDSWTAGALIIRNLLLNWLVIVPFLAFCVAIPQVAMLVMRTVPSHRAQAWVVGIAVALAFVASFFVHVLRHPNQTRGRATQQTIILAAVLPLYSAAVLLSLGASWAPWQWWGAGDSRGYFVTGPLARAEWRSGSMLFISIWSVFIPLAGWLVAELWRYVKREPDAPVSRGRSARWELFAIVVSGIAAGLLLWWVTSYALCGTECDGRFQLIRRSSLLTVLSLPTLLADYLLARALFVALASIGEEASHGHGADVFWNDYDREWWGRLSGWVLALAVGWLGVSTVCLLGDFIVQRSIWPYARQAVAAMGGIAGVATALLAKSAGTSAGRGTKSTSSSTVSHVSLKVAAPIFVVALLILLADGNAALSRRLSGEPSPLRVDPTPAASIRAFGQRTSAAAAEVVERCGSSERDIVCGVTVWKFIFFVPVPFLVVSLFFSWFVDINRFSLHGFYRNRLVRAFLGAANIGRQPDPFTGFALTDNIHLAKLLDTTATVPERHVCLVPLINTTLNLVTGTQRLAWQLRKAESFSMTPLFCGNFNEGYRRTSEYGGGAGITLGSAIAISGAAANPNMGYNSSSSITFLMTLFNARLGAWLGNTNERGAKTFKRPGPRMALWTLLLELLGRTDSTNAYVNLSDGGHFDNLGLYEVVLRRCHYVLLCDAGRDPSAGFEDLGNALRKIRIDFGIPIEFKEQIRIAPRGGSEKNLFCATASIRYSAADGAGVPDGRLIYIKPALAGRGAPVPYDVLAYANASEDFPHESTTDQWFDEAQFESYRALGLHVLNQITVAPGPFADLASFFDSVDQYVAAAHAGNAPA